MQVWYVCQARWWKVVEGVRRLLVRVPTSSCNTTAAATTTHHHHLATACVQQEQTVCGVNQDNPYACDATPGCAWEW